VAATLVELLSGLVALSAASAIPVGSNAVAAARAPVLKAARRLIRVVNISIDFAPHVEVTVIVDSNQPSGIRSDRQAKMAMEHRSGIFVLDLCARCGRAPPIALY
jgi:hypothetical protein